MELTCAKCGSSNVVGETWLGRPACYYHEDKDSYLERMAAEKAARENAS